MQNIKYIILIIILIVISSFPLFFIINSKNDSTLPDNSNLNRNLNYFNDVYSSDIPSEKISQKVYVEPESDIDLTDIKVLFDNADLVVVGTIESKGNGIMIEELGYPGISGKIKVDTLLKGNIATDSINFLSNGGYCTIKEYIDIISKTNPQRIEKMGISKLSFAEQQENYIIFNHKFGKNFNINQRYVLMLQKINEKFVSLSNYGFLEISQEVQINSLNDIINLSNK